MILMNDFKTEPIELRDAMVSAAERVLHSGWYILGDELVAFERKWAAACGVSYGIGVGNGMDAIEIILRTLNFGLGDEIITTPMTAFATVLAIIRAGCIPVLADIDPQTALLSVESVERCISLRTRAVLLVHLYGQVRGMDDWNAVCSSHNITLVEDCAQAHAAMWRGKVAGNFGIAGAYSFYPTKNLGALGDAGMIVTQDEAIAGRSMRLRNYGQSIRYHHPEIGLNSRLDEMQAAILNARLDWLTKFTERRRQIANCYLAGISNQLITQLAEPTDPLAHVYHLFVVLCDQRDALQKHLHNSTIQSLIHYPVPVHRQTPCLSIARDPRGLHNSDHHAATCLSLPCHPQMTDADVAEVVAAVNSFEGS